MTEILNRNYNNLEALDLTGKWCFIWLYSFFWVIPRRLFLCADFSEHCVPSSSVVWTRQMKMEQSVSKRRHIKFRRWGITQKREYDIHNTAEVWNQVFCLLINKCPVLCLRGCVWFLVFFISLQIKSLLLLFIYQLVIF